MDFQNLKKKPIIIAGPCSAESQDQVTQTARALHKTGKVQIFRAGIWKPRTRPGCFEGVGKKGLPWLEQAKSETGLLTAVEVANPRHVELSLKHNIDILWIGARTTTSPFAVQEIVESLKGTNYPIMIKNPVNQDLSLWIGAFERFQAASLNNLCAIHRGFSPGIKGKYRNRPSWEIPVKLREIFPKVPLICDPSHMGGKRELIEQISKKALEIDMNGLMIETHIKPELALSDSHQQITPSKLSFILQNLHSYFLKGHSGKSKLDKLRDEIDPIDEELLEILYKRMNVVHQIGLTKKKNNILPFQKSRMHGLIKNRITKGTQLGLKEKYIRDIYQIIHRESVEQQTEILKTN